MTTTKSLTGCRISFAALRGSDHPDFLQTTVRQAQQHIEDCGGTYTHSIDKCTHIIATHQQYESEKSSDMATIRIKKAQNLNTAVVTYAWLAESYRSSAPVNVDDHLLYPTLCRDAGGTLYSDTFYRMDPATNTKVLDKIQIRRYQDGYYVCRSPPGPEVQTNKIGHDTLESAIKEFQSEYDRHLWQKWSKFMPTSFEDKSKSQVLRSRASSFSASEAVDSDSDTTNFESAEPSTGDSCSSDSCCTESDSIDSDSTDSCSSDVDSSLALRLDPREARFHADTIFRKAHDSPGQEQRRHEKLLRVVEDFLTFILNIDGTRMDILHLYAERIEVARDLVGKLEEDEGRQKLRQLRADPGNLDYLRQDLRLEQARPPLRFFLSVLDMVEEVEIDELSNGLVKAILIVLSFLDAVTPGNLESQN